MCFILLFIFTVLLSINRPLLNISTTKTASAPKSETTTAALSITLAPHYEVQIGNGSVIAAGLAQSQLLLVEAGMSPEDATAAIYLPYLAGNGTDGDLDLEQETVQAAAIDANTYTKYYYFNGMRIAPFDSAQGKQCARTAPSTTCTAIIWVVPSSAPTTEP